MDERLEEILERLEALERRVADATPEASAPSAGSPCAFCTDERRIVDLIVRLTTENVVRALDERMRRMPGPRHGPPPQGWGPPPPGPHGPHHGGRGGHGGHGPHR